MDPEPAQETTTRRTSKLAIAAFVLGLLSLALSILAALPGVLIALVVLVFPGRRESLRGRMLALAGLLLCSASIVLCIGACWLWCHDAEPIPDDYTVADLYDPGPDYAKTYDLLCRFDQGNSFIGLTEADVDKVHQLSTLTEKTASELGRLPPTFVMESRELTKADVDTLRQLRDLETKDSSGFMKLLRDPMRESRAAVQTQEFDTRAFILDVWPKTAPARETIKELHRYDQIADRLTPGFDDSFDYLESLSAIMTVYGLRVHLHIEEGQYDKAVAELCEISHVSRALAPSARSLITKMMCLGHMRRTLVLANQIANEANVPPGSVTVLAEHFAPLTDGQCSFRNCLIFDYLEAKAGWELAFQGYSSSSIVTKRNSAFRMLRNLCDEYIARSGEDAPPPLYVYPRLCEGFIPNSRLHVDGEGEKLIEYRYQWYNPGGALFLTIMTPWHRAILDTGIRLRIQDDLFHIVLAARLGRPYSLKARAYSDEYVIDVERRIIYSPGPDGEPFTKDDITLPINPEVLGLTAGPQGTPGEPAGQALNPSFEVGTL